MASITLDSQFSTLPMRERVGSALTIMMRPVSPLPENGVMVSRIRGGRRGSDDLAPLVDQVRSAGRSAERTEIGHRTVLPEKRVRLARRGIRISDDLSSVVEVVCGAERTSQRAEIG